MNYSYDSIALEATVTVTTSYGHVIIGNGVITKTELLKILKSNHMASTDAEVARKADTIMAQAGEFSLQLSLLLLVSECILLTI
jgi:hypothetical protein